MSSTPSINFLRREKTLHKCYFLQFLTILVLLGITSGISCTKQAVAATLEIRVKDHREAIGDFSRLDLTFDTVRIKPKSGISFWKMGWNELKPSLEMIDLTKYIGNDSVSIFRGEVGSGTFEAVHLKIKAIAGMLKKNNGAASIKNLVGPIRVAFEVYPKKSTLLVLDLIVVDISDHPPRGYELHIKGYELYIDGALVDKIPPG